MIDIDRALARLHALPVHPELAAIDGRVLEGIAARSPSSGPGSRTLFGLAAMVALTIGIASSVVPPSPVRAADMAPFGAPPALAPSTLLGAGE